MYLGGFPVSPGEVLLAGLPSTDGEVMMPDWAEVGEEANVADFDADRLTAFYRTAIPIPEQVITTPIQLADERRYAVPATAICPEYSAAQLRGWIADGEVPELSRTEDLEFVDLPGGHWPQLTQPRALADALIDAAAR